MCLRSTIEVNMSQSPYPIIAARRAQILPRLEPAEIDRSRRFGEAKSYASGERVVKAGEIAPGLIVILSGKVQVTQGRGSIYRKLSSRKGRVTSLVNSRSSPPALRSWMLKPLSRSKVSSFLQAGYEI
jgi:CRP-like cAMP-binding protein